MLTILTIVLLSCDSFSSKQISIKYKNPNVETFIMKHEGFREKAYRCQGNRLSIGYGTTAVSINQKISQSNAQYELRKYLNNVSYKKIETYNLKLTPNQLIAASSFDYNTNKLEKIIVGHSISCNKILKYNTIKGKPNIGLTKRRFEEYSLCKK